MSTLGGADFTNFKNVRVRGTVDGSSSTPGIVRFAATNAFEGTLAMDGTYTDQNYAYTLPAKTGKFALGGTFAVDLPIVASGGYQATAITITGLRAEDGVTVTPMSIAASAVQSARGALVVVDARPTANTLTLTFANLFATATIAVTQGVMGYTVIR